MHVDQASAFDTGRDILTSRVKVRECQRKQAAKIAELNEMENHDLLYFLQITHATILSLA